jgi:hypothetical protein
MFGTGCTQANEGRVKEILRVENTTVHEKYLALPTEGRMKKTNLVVQRKG